MGSSSNMCEHREACPASHARRMLNTHGAAHWFANHWDTTLASAAGEDLSRDLLAGGRRFAEAENVEQFVDEHRLGVSRVRPLRLRELVPAHPHRAAARLREGEDPWVVAAGLRFPVREEDPGAQETRPVL